MDQLHLYGMISVLTIARSHPTYWTLEYDTLYTVLCILQTIILHILHIAFNDGNIIIKGNRSKILPVVCVVTTQSHCLG